MKKIVLISLNYYPEDTAIGLYSTAFSEELSKGNDVTVITGFPYYPQWKIQKEYQNKSHFYQDQYKNINILRYKQYVPRELSFLNRILLLISFTFGSIINIFKIKKCDLVIVVVPFIGSIILGIILKYTKKAKLMIHIQDFEFDAALSSGLVGKYNFIEKIYLKVERFLFNRADLLSTISHTMLAKLKLKTDKKTFLFPNFIIKNDDTKKTNISIDKTKFNILYSGNIGNKQDWDIYINLVKYFQDKTNINFILVGDGTMKEFVLHAVSEYSNIKYYPPISLNELDDLLSSASLHILFQKATTSDSVMPSKLISMMNSGIPSLISGSKISEVKDIIEQSEGGIYVSENVFENTINSIKYYIELPKDEYQKIGENAKKYITKYYSKENIFKSVEENIHTIFKSNK